MSRRPRLTIYPLVLWTAVTCSDLVLAPSSATAEGARTTIRRPFTGDRPFQLDVHAGFSHFGLGLATGARFGIPILDNGFVRSINNAVYLNFGADFYFVKHDNDYGPALGFPVALHWEFYFTDRWSAFAELGINVYLHSHIFSGRGWHWSPGHWVLGAVGGRLHVNQTVALTLRLGNPYSAFGVTFMF